MASTILVTGASGFVGRAAVTRLVRGGWRVRALTRRPDASFQQGVEPLGVDLATGAGLSASVFDDVDVILHCAGEIRDPAVMRALHVGGTARLLHCVRAAARGSRRIHWVQVSSVGAYGPPRIAGEYRRVDEETPEDPVGEYETTKVESDRLVREAAAEGIMSVTVLRPSAVIGPAMPNQSLPRVIALVTRRRFVHIGAADTIANYVHVDDVATALWACVTESAARGQSFNLSSDCTWRQLIEWIAARVRVAPPRLRLPAAPLRLLLRTPGLGGKLPLTAHGLDALTNRTHYPNTRIESVLGFCLARPLPAGLADIVTPAAGA